VSWTFPSQFYSAIGIPVDRDCAAVARRPMIPTTGAQSAVRNGVEASIGNCVPIDWKSAVIRILIWDLF
jgi:hypothetical protein